MRRTIASQLVGHKPLGQTTLPLQQFAEKALRRRLVATRLDQNIDHLTILINRTPEILPLPLSTLETSQFRRHHSQCYRIIGCKLCWGHFQAGNTIFVFLYVFWIFVRWNNAWFEACFTKEDSYLFSTFISIKVQSHLRIIF